MPGGLEQGFIECGGAGQPQQGKAIGHAL
jgi:hypothetical protein